ncbi:MAG: universal stress protein [Rhodospirillales bacterium]|nr:universal stress protein [Rhodospirillales bacterium]
MISNIVLATDGSGHANHAQKTAIDLAVKYDAKLTLVHILTHDHSPAEMERMVDVEHMAGPDPLEGSNLSDISMTMGRMLGGSNLADKEARVIVALGEQIIKTVSRAAKEAGVKDVASEIRPGDYANGILDVAKRVDADLIVMGRRGLSTLKGFVTGSVSHKVSQRANCSVLTVK